VGGQDPSHRFDYLFEPIDGETTTTTALPAVRSAVAVQSDGAVESAPRARRWWPVPVMAVIVALAGAVVLILMWPGRGDVVPAPAPSVPPTPVVTSTPVVASPTEPTAEPVPPPVPPQEATTKVATEPVLVPLPAAPSAPPAAPPSSRPATPPAPTVRSPISVSPEPRPAFPNQRPPEGDQGPGGLLPGLGGLL
jgi:hypothetical protein